MVVVMEWRGGVGLGGMWEAGMGAATCQPAGTSVPCKDGLSLLVLGTPPPPCFMPHPRAPCAQICNTLGHSCPL